MIVSKMEGIFLVLCIIPSLILCESMTIVLDTTYSMRDDVEIIKNNIRSVVDAVRLEQYIDEFILVPFNDPDVGVPVKTSSPEEFFSAVDAVKTSGGIDCPENSLTGIRKGLEISEPESFIFLFTDAFANDYNQVSPIKHLCMTTRSKVIVFLSGYCDKGEGTKEIYNNITDHCYGAVFQLDYSNFRKAFQLMKLLTTAGFNSIQSYAPNSDQYEFEISVDAVTSTVMIMATGINPVVAVQDCIECVEVMRDSKSFYILRVRPHIGTYTATLKCDSCSSLTVYKRLDLKFEYGFSPRPVQNLRETTQKPIPGITNYITICLKTDSLIADSMELQTDGSPVSTLQMEQMASGCYYSTTYITVEKRYRIVIVGHDSSTSQRLTGATNILTPQRTGFVPESIAPVVELIKPDNTLLEFGASLTVACRVTAYPKPDIWWEDNSEQKLNSENIVLETPAVYVSYATINVTSNSTIFCKAKNLDGMASQSVKINVNKTAILEFVQQPKDNSFEYGKEGKIYCEVNSYPEATIKWYHNDTTIENSDNIQINTWENSIVIKKMELDDVGEYTCEVNNTVETQSVTASIDISGLEYPEVATDLSEISIKLGEQAKINCRIVKGNPKPEVTWQYKLDDNTEFGEIPEEAYYDIDDKVTNKTSNKIKRSLFDLIGVTSTTKDTKQDNKLLTINTNKAGVYKCKGSNILGESSKEIIVKVQIPPKIRNGEDEIITVKQRHRVELPCEVDAIPSATVHWEISQGDNVVALSDRHHTDEKNTLRFDALSNDSGSYYCIAENIFGRVFKRYTVNVQVSPYIETPKLKTILARIGSTVVLPCIVSGYPEPSTRWEFSAADAPPVTILRGNSTNVLELKNISKSQEGSYSCIAVNSVGIDNIKIVVNVD